jgi:hypothetical protein
MDDNRNMNDAMEKLATDDETLLTNKPKLISLASEWCIPVSPISCFAYS